MQHELAMRYLAEQRSEQLIGQAERHNLAAGLRPARSGRSARIGRSVAALVARATTSRREAQPGVWYRARADRRSEPGPGVPRLRQPGR
jgi:hypothetical protein